MKKKIVTVIGARPQFIKAACVSRIFQQHDSFQEILLHTGQHYDDNMSQIFFDDLALPEPAYNLAIGSGHHGKQTGEMLAGIEEILLKEKPDGVLIYGDTNSTLAGALAAIKLHIPVAHVEAGLRSFNRRMPEEINRIAADQLSELLFAPTAQAVINLRNEGVAEQRIHEVGDVMYDVALFSGAKAEQHSRILQTLQLTSKNYVLATIHRAENTDDEQRLCAIFKGLMEVAKKIPVTLPLHPRTRKMLQHYDLFDSVAQALHLIEPVGFLDMVMLEKHAAVIVTDSGGVQKEAFFYQVPCVTLRDETEWVELVELGWNRVVSPKDADTVNQVIHSAMNNNAGDKTAMPYGNGKAGEMIVSILARYLN